MLNVILEVVSSVVQLIYSAHFLYFRGISSTVRRCIEKETGIEFAAKIIDLSNDSHDGGGEGKTMLEATIEEVKILRLVAGHPYISKFGHESVYICFDYLHAWQLTDIILFQSKCTMSLSQALSYSLYLSCVRMVNYLTI